jgi:hypothetical protein
MNRQGAKGGLFDRLFVLAGILIFAALVSGTATAVYWRHKKPHPRVAEGESLLVKRRLLSHRALGPVTDIVKMELLKKEGVEIGVAGKNGAIILDSELHLLKSVTLSDVHSRVQSIDLEGDGICEYLDRGGFGWSRASVHGNDGKMLWAYGDGKTPGHLAMDDMAAGPLDADGQLDFVVGANGSDGIRRLDARGTEVWIQPDGNVWQVEIVDLDGDGVNEILNRSADPYLKVRDAKGESIRTVPVEGSRFALVHWPKKEKALALLSVEGKAFVVHSLTGEILAKLRAPKVNALSNPPGAQWVRFKGNPEPFLVILAQRFHYRRHCSSTISRVSWFIEKCFRSRWRQ